MMKYTIQHKYCGITATIEGYTIWDAFRSFNKDPRYWNVVAAEDAK